MEDEYSEQPSNEEFSKAHPLNDKIKDSDIFLHGTSSKKIEKIQSCGFLKRKSEWKKSVSPILYFDALTTRFRVGLLCARHINILKLGNITVTAVQYLVKYADKKVIVTSMKDHIERA